MNLIFRGNFTFRKINNIDLDEINEILKKLINKKGEKLKYRLYGESVVVDLIERTYFKDSREIVFYIDKSDNFKVVKNYQGKVVKWTKKHADLFYKLKKY